MFPPRKVWLRSEFVEQGLASFESARWGAHSVQHRGLLRSQLVCRLSCGATFRALVRNDLGAAAKGNFFAADSERCLEAQAHFLIEQFVAVTLGLRDTRGERSTFGNHRFNVDLPAIEGACIGPFNGIARAHEIIVTAAQVPWLENWVDQHRPSF